MRDDQRLNSNWTALQCWECQIAIRAQDSESRHYHGRNHFGATNESWRKGEETLGTAEVDVQYVWRVVASLCEFWTLSKIDKFIF